MLQLPEGQGLLDFEPSEDKGVLGGRLGLEALALDLYCALERLNGFSQLSFGLVYVRFDF